MSAGTANCYLLRSDGSIDRVSGSAWHHRGTILPPAGAVYTAVSAGAFASYFLRSDGAVDRTKGQGVVCDTLIPPLGVTYTAVSAGTRQT